VRAADGFQLPVGPNGTGSGYYIARGVRPNGHLGEDWNGLGGGDTDLGDPVYAVANGYVTFARNYHVGWGNVVILRHAYYEGSELKYCDSLYGHLLDFSVREGEQVHRGQQIGRIGNNFGMYEAHLHLEMRKNLEIGMFRSSFLRDFSNYYVPNEFIAEHRACPHPNSMVKCPINTYPAVAPPVIAGPKVESPIIPLPHAGSAPTFAKVNPLPPQGSSGLAAALLAAPRIVTSTPTPAPAIVIHESKRSSEVVFAPTPATPVPKSSSVAKVSPKVSFVDHSVEETSGTPAPTAMHFKTGVSKSGATASTASLELAPELPGKSEKLAKTAASTAATTSSSAKHSKSVASATPSPASKSHSEHSKPLVAASTPAPKRGSKVLPPVADAPEAASTVIESRKPRKATKTAEESPVATGNQQVFTSKPVLPTPEPNTPETTPLVRTSNGYKVDRYEDLRTKGY
jgi:hypothetical protein